MSGDPDRPTGVARWVPGLRLVRNYERSWLRHDVVAAIVLSAGGHLGAVLVHGPDFLPFPFPFPLE